MASHITPIRSGASPFKPRGPSPMVVRTIFDRVFDHFRSDLEVLLKIPQQGTGDQPVEIVDVGDHYSLFVHIPGLSKDEINIEVTPFTVLIHAEQRLPSLEKKTVWLYCERAPRDFTNHIEFPEAIREEYVEANLNDGLLTIILPKVKPLTAPLGRLVSIK